MNTILQIEEVGTQVQKVKIASKSTLTTFHPRQWLTLKIRYLPALYNPKTKTLHLPSTSPLYLVSHAAKRLKTLPLSSTSSKLPDYRAKRNDLGEAFGTRKAKSQIKADERNKVDVSAMESVRGHFMESIGESKMVIGGFSLRG